MIKKVIDAYLKRPIITDFLAIVSIWIVSSKLEVFNFKMGEQDKLLDILSSLIGTMISLSGFILAALTIIVTFKSSLRARGIEDATNALEMLFSSRHYAGIVKVFKDAIIEFVLYSLIAYIVWQSYDNFSLITFNRIIVSIILLIGFTSFRSLFIMFKILNLENYQRN